MLYHCTPLISSCCSSAWKALHLFPTMQVHNQFSRLFLSINLFLTSFMNPYGKIIFYFLWYCTIISAYFSCHCYDTFQYYWYTFCFSFVDLLTSWKWASILFYIFLCLSIYFSEYRSCSAIIWWINDWFCLPMILWEILYETLEIMK